MRRPKYPAPKPWRRAGLRARRLSTRIVREVIKERGRTHAVPHSYSCGKPVQRLMPGRVQFNYPWRRWAWKGPQRTLGR
jgi:hypothetical protein